MSENFNVNYFQNGEIIIEAQKKQEWKEASEEKRPEQRYYVKGQTFEVFPFNFTQNLVVIFLKIKI